MNFDKMTEGKTRLIEWNNHAILFGIEVHAVLFQLAIVVLYCCFKMILHKCSHN